MCLKCGILYLQAKYLLVMSSTSKQLSIWREMTASNFTVPCSYATKFSKGETWKEEYDQVCFHRIPYACRREKNHESYLLKTAFGAQLDFVLLFHIDSHHLHHLIEKTPHYHPMHQHLRIDQCPPAFLWNGRVRNTV